MESSRELILKRIRTAIDNRVERHLSEPDFSSPVQAEIKGSLVEKFKSEFKENLGEIFLCENEEQAYSKLKSFLRENTINKFHCIDPKLQDKLSQVGISFTSEQEDFYEMEAGLTACEFLIARFGSIMVSSAHASGRAMNVFPHTHIVMAGKSQIVPELKDALNGMGKRYPDVLPSMISTITGPSRTADIEKTLVMGAHGPKRLVVFIDLKN